MSAYLRQSSIDPGEIAPPCTPYADRKDAKVKGPFKLDAKTPRASSSSAGRLR